MSDQANTRPKRSKPRSQKPRKNSISGTLVEVDIVAVSSETEGKSLSERSSKKSKTNATSPGSSGRMRLAMERIDSSSESEDDMEAREEENDHQDTFIHSRRLSMQLQPKSPSVTGHPGHEKAQSLIKMSQSEIDAGGQDVGTSILKSVIMVKRNRSKSESMRPSQTPQGSSQGMRIDTSNAVITGERMSWHSTQSAALATSQAARDDGNCVVCQEGHAGQGNQIVLCDSCDRGFHQLCSLPIIDNKYVDIQELEWICHHCTGPLDSAGSYGLSSLASDMSLTGDQVSKEVKEEYLRSLPRAGLVKLIARIESSAPTVKMYPAHLSSPVVLSASDASFSRPNPMDAYAEKYLPVSTSFLQSVHPLDSSSERQAYHGPHHATPFSKNDAAQTGTRFGGDYSKILATPVLSQPGPPIPPSATAPTWKSDSSVARDLGDVKAPANRSSSGVASSPGHHPPKAQDLPPYEEMIFAAIEDLRQDAGSAPKAILDWVQEHYPVAETFRASCGQAISKAAKKGRLLKEGSLYKLKPGYNYPRRSSKHGHSRARSQSHTLSTPQGMSVLQPQEATSHGPASPFDHINSIIDANLYGILPSPPFQLTSGVNSPGLAGEDISKQRQGTPLFGQPFSFNMHAGRDSTLADQTTYFPLQDRSSGHGVEGTAVSMHSTVRTPDGMPTLGATSLPLSSPHGNNQLVPSHLCNSTSAPGQASRIQAQGLSTYDPALGHTWLGSSFVDHSPLDNLTQRPTQKAAYNSTIFTHDPSDTGSLRLTMPTQHHPVLTNMNFQSAIEQHSEQSQQRPIQQQSSYPTGPISTATGMHAPSRQQSSGGQCGASTFPLLFTPQNQGLPPRMQSVSQHSMLHHRQLYQSMPLPISSYGASAVVEANLAQQPTFHSNAIDMAPGMGFQPTPMYHSEQVTTPIYANHQQQPPQPQQQQQQQRQE